MNDGPGSVGDWHERIVLDEQMVTDFIECTGDRNPVHWDPAFAASTAFGRPICHGPLAVGLLGRILGNSFPGPGTIYLGHDIRFKPPLFVGDEALFEVSLLRELDRQDWYLLRTQVRNVDGETCIDGQATVWKPGGIQA